MARPILSLFISLLLSLSAHAATFTVNTTADTNDGTCDAVDCSLREAMHAANAAAGPDSIAFAIGSGPVTITLASALPDLTSPTILDGTTQPGYAGVPLIALTGVTTAHGLVLRASDSAIRGLDIGNCIDAISVIADNIALTNLSFERNFIGTRLVAAPVNRRAISLETIGTGSIAGVAVGNATAAGRNLLATFGFVADALYIGGNVRDVTVAGNYFGLAEDVAATPLLTTARFITDIGIYGSAGSGNFVIGGTTPGARNVFGGGGGTQIHVKVDSAHTGLQIEGNYFGTDPTGTIARRATNFAIWFFGQGEAVIRNNVITAGNTAVSRGVTTTGPVTVQGNWINYKADSSGPFPAVPATAINDFSSAPGYTIGGPNPGDGNVIVNYSTAISVNSPGALVQGNLLGLDPTGTNAVGSGLRGLQSAFARNEPGVFFRDNRIAGWTTGIDIGSETLVTIDGNFIGTNAAGTTARPNTVGLQISNAAGRAVVTNNVISGNLSHGVVLQTTTMPVTLNGNRIGLSATNTPLGNGGDGIRVTSGTALKSIGTAVGAGNSIAHNLGNGISVTGGSATTIFRTSIFANTGLAIDLGADGVTANDANDADTGANGLQNAPSLTVATVGGGVTTIHGMLHSTPSTTFTIELFANSAVEPLGFGEAETFLSRFLLTTDASGNATIAVTTPAVSAGSTISATATNLTTGDTSEMSNSVTASSGVVQFAAATATIGESGTLIPLTVTRTGGLGSTTSVEYTSANATAEAGSDYEAVSGTLTFGAGESSKTVNVPITADAFDEVDESFTVTLGNVIGGQLGAPATTTVTITDDDALPVLGISDPSVVEGNSGTTSIVFQVSLASASAQAVAVDYTTVDGTASSGSDYGARFGTLTFAPGEITRTITVTVNGDVAAEGDEVFTVVLSNVANATIGDSSGTGTITNDDGSPSIAIEDATVIEGNGGATSASIVVTLTHPSGSAVTADWMTAGNTASSGSDFTASSGSVTFAPGVTSQTVVVPLLGDTTVEGNESFFVDLTNPLNGTIGDAQSMVTVVDDDGSPALTISDLAVDESAGTATLTVLLAPASAQTVTAAWTTVNGTAVSGSDFVSSSGTVTFSAGQTARTIDITLTNDSVAESAETFTLSLSTPSNATIADGDATITLIDDDPVPTISVQDEGVLEGSVLTFTVTLSNARDLPVSVQYSTATGSAGPGDFTSVSGTLLFAPGELTKTIPVPTSTDVLQEPEELFFLDLSGATGGTVTRPRATGTITDDDGAPSLVIGNANVVEGNAGVATASFLVTLAGSATQTVSVEYATADGTASAGSDYAATSGQLLFPAGTTTRTIEVPVIGDLTVEPGETFFLNLSNAAGASIADNQGFATISNDDVAAVIPNVTVDDAGVLEGNAGTATLTFVISLSAATTTTVTVDYATANGTAVAGADYGAVTGTVVFAPGVVTRTVHVAIAGDLAVEGNETFSFQLTNAANATVIDAVATGTILDDDTAPMVPAVSIGNASVVEGNAGTVAMTFHVTLSAPTTLPVTVGFSTADGSAVASTDYASQSGTLVFVPGVTVQPVTVAIAGDTSVEGNETLLVNLTSATNATLSDAQALGTILDDDSAPAVVSISIENASVAEGDGGVRNAVFEVTLDQPSAIVVQVGYATVSGTATSGEDFASTQGTLTFAPGRTTETIAVAVAGDTRVEDDETFTVRLSNAVNASIADVSGRGTIRDDDESVTPQLAVEDIEVREGDGVALFTLRLSTSPTVALPVLYETIEESASASSDYAATTGTIVFAPGETVHTLAVTVSDDDIVEEDETFVLQLSTGARARALVHDDDGGISSILVIGGSGAGNQGSFFRTVLQLHNAGATSSSGDLIVRPMGGGAPRTYPYALNAHETRDLGSTIDVPGFVTVDLLARTGSIPRTSVRVFNDAGPNGRNGFTTTLIPITKAIRAGERSLLLGPDDAAGMRLNLGIRALGDGATVRLMLRRADGTVRAESTRIVGANVLEQIAAASLFGTAMENHDVVEIAVTAGAAIVYGSAIDNLSQDPSFTVAEPNR